VKTALLDVNVLVALQWPAHEHHDAAHRWYTKQAMRRWASCPLTQLAFVRILSNPSVTRDALSTGHAISLLEKGLAHAAHVFWPDDAPGPSALKPVAAALQGHQQLTDAYLLVLAHHRQGTLATFDRGLRTLAGKTFESVIEVVPTR